MLEGSVSRHQGHRLLVNDHRCSWVSSPDDFENVRDADDFNCQVNVRFLFLKRFINQSKFVGITLSAAFALAIDLAHGPIISSLL